MAESRNKYAFLEQMTTEQLKILIRVDSESTEGFDQDLILYALELLIQREDEDPSESHSDVNKAWQEFLQYYNIPEGNDRSLYGTAEVDAESDSALNAAMTSSVCRRKPIRLRRILRAGFVAVISVMLLFAGMITAQAAGVDIFGALGRWTEENFHFETNPDAKAAGYSDPQHKEYHDMIQETLLELGITEDLAPKWYPKGYSVHSCEIINSPISNYLEAVFVNRKGECLIFDVRVYNPDHSAFQITYEKDDYPIEVYTANGKTFFIMSNLNHFIAAWASSDGQMDISVSAPLRAHEVKTIIDSIGG